MAQLKRGARRLLDLLDADLSLAAAQIRDAHAAAQRNPALARDALDQALELITTVRERITEELEPLLERQTPEPRQRDLECRVAQLEQVVNELRQR